MADDEQFSLCWNNFNSNLSAGFHESLCRGDLVDVTLAAEGQFVKAHRLVLSVCSPYFRKMFTQMPAHQHAFVFLKDVSHSALKDLIQFMYCGEVNVKQEALPAFISTAEALQIKGLTDSDPPPPQSPAKSSTPAPQPASTQQQQQVTPPRARQRISTSRSYKIEAIEDSGDDNKQSTQIVIQAAAPQQTQQTTIVQHHQPQQQSLHHQQTTTTASVVSQKRPATQRSINTVHTKRIKSSIDPLDGNESTGTTQQISVQNVVADSKVHAETEFIDLPIELPTKSEPDYAEETGEVETAEQETTYVEDDSYGDMRYDESYFTENEETANPNANSGGGTTTAATTSKAVIKQQSFSDSSYVEAGDQSANEAQESLQNSSAPPKRQRRKKGCQKPEKLMDRIVACVVKGAGQAVLYASTTKGGMKIIYEGHHFKYSFRSGMYTVFQCVYKEINEQCKVRVVVCNKRVYHLDGEHVHFNQALDKSVTSMVLDTTQDDDEDDVNIMSEDHHSDSETTIATFSKKALSKSEQDDYTSEIVEINPEDLREQIKKRLQKALFSTKKK